MPQLQLDFPIIGFDAIPYLVRQRTRMQRLVSKEYFEMMATEYGNMKPFLPQKAAQILDIGGGLGGVDIHLWRHYDHDIELNILDKIGLDKDTYFGFKDVASKYNDPVETAKYLKAGGVPNDRFMFWNADTDMDRLNASEIQFDVIISLKSWCFHYPFSTYAELAAAKLSANGRMFVDVRVKNQHVKIEIDQIEEIARYFEIISRKKTDATSERLILGKKN